MNPIDKTIFLNLIGIVSLGFLLAFLYKKIVTFYKAHFKKKVSEAVYQIKFARHFIIFCCVITALLFAFKLPEAGFLAFIFTFLAMLEFKNELFFVKRTIKYLFNTKPSDKNDPGIVSKPILHYSGAGLHFSTDTYNAVLTKRLPFYNKLSPIQREEFLSRLKEFIADKGFFIHSKEGFKEMPILISAAAIQLTFGLKKYLLPYFKNIHIYPEEFFRADERGICFLEGNVSGNNINLSWKHFLKGYEFENDGQNTGLHEIAHALFFQTFIADRYVDKNFRYLFDDFSNHGNKASAVEKQNNANLYSAYADKNFQEFWAESVEIFFEKPWQLKNTYPALYEALSALLNQNPCATIIEA